MDTHLERATCPSANVFYRPTTTFRWRRESLQAEPPVGKVAMSKKARARVIVAKLFSSAGTGFTYTFRRPRTSPKFELRKYDPVVNQHVLFTENKPAKPGN